MSHSMKYVRRLMGYLLANKGLFLVTLAMGVVGFGVTFIYPWAIGKLIDKVIAPPPDAGLTEADRLRWLVFLTALGAATAVLFAVAGYGRGHYNLKLGNRIVTQLRRDLFDHFQNLSLQFYARQRSGGIVWKLVHEVHGVNGLIHGGFMLVFLDAIQLALAIALMAWISWPLTVATLVLLPLYVLTFKVFNPFVRRTSDAVGCHLGMMSGNVQEQFANVALVKTYATEDREKARFRDDAEHHYALVVRQSHVGHLMGAISETWIHLGTTIIIGLGGYLALAAAVRGGRGITPGDLTAFLGYTGILYGPIRRFADLNIVWQNSLSAMRRVFRIFEIEPRIRERPDAVDRPPERGEVVLQGVRFHYDEDCDESRISLDEDGPVDLQRAAWSTQKKGPPRWVLDGVDLTIHPGQRVALVGPSGSGKSTLAALIPRLYDVVEGRVLIDGIDLRDYRIAALRHAIGVVQQESFIFSGTIRENIVYGRPDATDEQIVAAARAANAHGFIAELPNGYDTLLGERGINLSGGQKQRVSIARALLKDPRVLILDEATSSLDTQSEALVQQALERLMVGRTCLIIAHRLSTIRGADRIFVLDRGRILESGTHDELIRRNGMYARLVRHQQTHPDDDAPPTTDGATEEMFAGAAASPSP